MRRADTWHIASGFVNWRANRRNPDHPRPEAGHTSPLPLGYSTYTIRPVCYAQDLSVKTPEAPETRLDQPLTTRAANAL